MEQAGEEILATVSPVVTLFVWWVIADWGALAACDTGRNAG
jgi:hypothetical protein